MDTATKKIEVPDTRVLPEYSSLGLDSSNPWILLLVISISVLIVSISFNVFLIRKNETLRNQRTQQLNVASQVERSETMAKSMVEEVARYSLTHPDVRDILVRYGVTINIVPPSGADNPPPVPSPFQKK
jgi:hypothetical protein